MNGMTGSEGSSLAPTQAIAPARLRSLVQTRVSARSLDILLVVGLFLVALAVRLPYLMAIPPFTDETVGVLISMDVSQGKEFPLVNVNPYYGSLFNYLLGGLFYVFGPSAETARLLTTVVGALTVPLVYFFVKAIEDRLTALLAALLMLASAAHVVNGHVAWENEITPFFATATFLLLVLALKRGSGVLLVAAGLVFGLTVQTHPGVLVLAAGLTLSFVYAGLRPPPEGARRSLREWLRSPWPYLALLAVAIGLGNVIAYNILQPGIGWTDAQTKDYAFQPSPSLRAYLVNMQNYAVLTLRMAASTFVYRSQVAQLATLLVHLVYLAVLLAGAGYAIKRHRPLPVLVLLTAGLILPYFNRAYGFPVHARYVGYLFPLLYMLLAVALVQAARSGRGARSWRVPLLGLLALFLVTWPLLSLMLFYRFSLSAGLTNERMLAVSQAARRQYETGAVAEILVDKRLGIFRPASGNNPRRLASYQRKGDVRGLNPTGGGGSVERTLSYLFSLEGTPHRTMKITPEAIRAELDKDPSRPLALVLSQRSYESLSAEMKLSQVIKARLLSKSNRLQQYGLYIVGPGQQAGR